MANREPTLVIDAYGGADAPRAVVAAAAARSLEGRARLVLVGDASVLGAELGRHGYDPMRLRIVGAGVPQPHVTGDDLALREAARASLPICLEMLREGEADALISFSPPEVVQALARETLAPLRPGLQAALASVVPTMPRSGNEDPLALLLDVSGIPTQDPAAICDWAVLGATYARVVSGIRQPSVGLLATDVDPGAGPDFVRVAHRALRRGPGVRFVGNLRAVDIPRGLADVVVVDGFAGFAVRGLLEGITELTVDAARYAWKTRTTWRVGLRLLSQGVGMLRRVSEFREYGGAPILGLERLVLVAAPTSTEAAAGNALKLAGKCVRRDLEGELRRALDAAAAWRPDAATEAG